MAKVSCPKCGGSGCSFCGGSGEVEEATKEEKKQLGRKNQGTKNPRKGPGKK